MHRCHHPEDLCMIPPHPELRARMDRELERLREAAAEVGPLLRTGIPDRPGLNDGLIVPGDRYPAGTSLQAVRSAALERAPLHGKVRVIVVLAEFEDRRFSAAHGREHFRDLFFSSGAGASVRDYYAEVSHGTVEVVGDVVGPYLLPRRLSAYAGVKSGMQDAEPNARTMARDAAEAANRDVDFGPYDNDGNGFVDAFIVVHAGPGGEATGSGGDIWSHKWVLARGEYNADGTRIYAYLTVPEDARLGVCCHELGHLLFGWPDLYDTDGSSEGLGNWCLMAAGSWNGGGDVPAHPSAWCKAQQSWVSVVNQGADGTLSVPDVKDGRSVYRLWKDGAQGNEYFLVENRQRKLFDRDLPGDGLLVYHVDDAVAGNTDERHPRVGLLQADGREDLNAGRNRGDAGDSFPGSARNTTLTAATTPSTKAYNNVATGVSLTAISGSGAVMSARVAVRATAAPKKRRHGLFGAAGQPQPGVSEHVRELVAELYQAVSASPGSGGGTGGQAGGDDDWRASIEARLAAVESASARAPGYVDVGDLQMVPGGS